MAAAEQDRSSFAFGAAPAHDGAVALGNHALPAGTALSCIAGLDGLATLEAGWRALEAQAPPTSVFQNFDWLSHWSAVYVGRKGSPEPLVVAGHQDQRLVFAWPLMKTRVGPLTVLRWATEPLAQYGDILIARGHCPRIWLERATAHLASMGAADLIRLRHVRDDALATPYLRDRFRDAQMNDQAPWLDLSAFADEAAYDARYTSGQRKRRKKIRKAIEDDFGPVAFEVLEAGAETDAAIARAIAEKCQWLDDRGRHNRALCDTALAAFLGRLPQQAETGLKLVVSRMTAGGRPVSWEIGLRRNTTHFGFITSHVTALTDYSPARLHMDLSQRRALKDGMTVFDLMVPNDAHKQSWSSAKIETRDYYLPLTPLGRLYGAGYLETARPLLRNAYYRMPPRLLRLLKPILRH